MSLLEDYTSPSPTFDFSPFTGDYGMDNNSRADDDTSLISLDPQNDSLTSDGHPSDAPGSLLDDAQSSDMNLPSPIKPVVPSSEDYYGFTIQGSNIPTIPCSTGADSLQQLTSSTFKNT